MPIMGNALTLAENLTSVSSGWSSDYRESIQHMLESLPEPTLERIAALCAGHSYKVHEFLARMVIADHRGEGIAKGTDTSDVLVFAAGIAPIAMHFDTMSPLTVDRWFYMSTVITKQRGNTISADDLTSFHRGLALTLFVDPQNVNGDAAHLIWLGSRWDKVEPYILLLIERSSVERSFVEQLADDSNGPPLLSTGIL